MVGELVLLPLIIIPGTEQSMEEVRSKRGKKKIKAAGLLALAGEQNGSERKDQEKFCTERQGMQ